MFSSPESVATEAVSTHPAERGSVGAGRKDTLAAGHDFDPLGRRMAVRAWRADDIF